MGLEFAVYEPAGEPICVITWRGVHSSLGSIMLNAHMDVVPADEVS
jgi:acetylornithine deacetylase/succinyl-diaminopimelate desuccinylase-like protein